MLIRRLAHAVEQTARTDVQNRIIHSSISTRSLKTARSSASPAGLPRLLCFNRRNDCALQTAAAPRQKSELKKKLPNKIVNPISKDMRTPQKRNRLLVNCRSRDVTHRHLAGLLAPTTRENVMPPEQAAKSKATSTFGSHKEWKTTNRPACAPSAMCPCEPPSDACCITNLTKDRLDLNKNYAFSNLRQETKCQEVD